jgi:DNA-binding NarL/FixJ family response regulator
MVDIHEVLSNDNEQDKPTAALSIGHPLAARYLFEKLQHCFNLVLDTNVLSSSQSFVIVLDNDRPSTLLRKQIRDLSRVPNHSLLLISEPLPLECLCALVLLGLKGFVLYDDVDRSLPEAIRTLSTGNLRLPSAVISQAIAIRAKSSAWDHETDLRLTRAETALIKVLRTGRLCNKELATALNISERTVKFHLSNVFRKLGVHDRYSLADSLRASANRRVILEESEAEEIRGVAGAASTIA